MLVGIDGSKLARFSTLPEGRHMRARLAGRDMLACARLSGWSLRKQGFEEAFLQIEKASTPEESVVAAAGDMLLEPAARASETLVPDMIEAWYERIVDGLSVRSADRTALQRMDDRRRMRAIVAKACALDGMFPQEGSVLPPVLRALVAFDLFQALRPFPAANVFLGRLVYAHILASNRMGFVSLVPVADFIQRWRAGTSDFPGFAVDRPFAEAFARGRPGEVVWSEYYRVVVRYLLSETRWLGRKAAGMLARRERLKTVLDACSRLNERQRLIVLEALLHDDAEFTVKRHRLDARVAYSTAHDDLAYLVDQGLLRPAKEGRELYFVPCEEPWTWACAYFRAEAPDAFGRFYDESGRLRKEQAVLDETGDDLYYGDEAFWSPGEWPQYETVRRRAIFTQPLGRDDGSIFDDVMPSRSER